MGTSGAIEPVSYRNPRFPALAVEAMTLGELRSRVPGRHLRHSSRPQFHQLIHLSAGQTPHYVDFVRYELAAPLVAKGIGQQHI